MTLEERRDKLKYYIECLKCEVSGKECDDNCSTQYEAGTMGEVIENLECILGILEREPCDNAISRWEALKLADDLKHDLPDDAPLADMTMAHNEGVLDYQTKLSLLPLVKSGSVSESREYYMVCNAEGSGYGGFDTLDEAVKSLNTQDYLNNDGSYDRVIKVVEMTNEVYRRRE